MTEKQKIKRLINNLEITIKELLPYYGIEDLPDWIEQVIFDFWSTTDADMETVPENERGRDWFANDGIDCRRTRLAAAINIS